MDQMGITDSLHMMDPVCIHIWPGMGAACSSWDTHLVHIPACSYDGAMNSVHPSPALLGGKSSGPIQQTLCAACELTPRPMSSTQAALWTRSGPWANLQHHCLRYNVHLNILISYRNSCYLYLQFHSYNSCPKLNKSMSS